MTTKNNALDPTAVVAALPLPGYVKDVPAALHEVLCNIAVLDGRITAMERQHAVFCAQVATDVLDRKGPDGKPVATNDAMRKALVEIEVDEDEECRLLLRELDQLRRHRAVAQADAEVLRMAGRLLAAAPGQGL